MFGKQIDKQAGRQTGGWVGGRTGKWDRRVTGGQEGDGRTGE